MSYGLILATDMEDPYIYSPVDDLEACFWVVLWSVLFNKDHEELLSDRERNVREVLAKGGKDCAMGRLGLLGKNKDNIMQRFWPVLMAWWHKVRDKHGEWTTQVT